MCIPCVYHAYTMRIPCIYQAGVFAGSDFCLTLVLTLYFTSAPDPTAWPYFVLLWAVAALVYEVQQISSRKPNPTLTLTLTLTLTITRTRTRTLTGNHNPNPNPNPNQVDHAYFGHFTMLLIVINTGLMMCAH